MRALLLNMKPQGLPQGLLSARWRAKLSQLPEQNSSVPLQRVTSRERLATARRVRRLELLELPRAAS